MFSRYHEYKTELVSAYQNRLMFLTKVLLYYEATYKSLEGGVLQNYDSEEVLK